MTTILGRLVGRVPAVIVLGLMDKLKDILDSWVDGLGEKLSDRMADFTTWGVNNALKFYTNDLLPEDTLFSYGKLADVFGSFNSLAVKILTIFVIISILSGVVAIARQRRMEMPVRTTASALRFMIFVFAFFPGYSLMLTLVTTFGEKYLELAAGISRNDGSRSLADQMISLILPDSLFMQAVIGLVNGVIMLFLIVEGMALVIVGIMTAITFGLSTVMRPAGTPGLNQYKFSVAVLWTVPASIIAITFLLGLDIVLIRGAGSTGWADLGGFTALFISIVFGILMVLAPLVIGWLIFNKVEHTITSGENRIQNAVDIATMPDVEARQIATSSQRSEESVVSQLARELPVAIASGENGPGTETKELLKQVAIQRAMASGVPVVGAAAGIYTAVKTVSSIAKSMKDDGGDKDE